MITPGYVQRMAAYNRWMNGAIYGACGTLSEDQRKEECSAFFGSIHATLNHLLWADQIWMHRFSGTPKPVAGNIPESVSQHDGFDALRSERDRFDAVIEDWAASLDPVWLEGDLTWFSGASGREMTMPCWVLVTHLFNHQTHHRGQVHCLLTQFGVETPITDIPFAPAT